MTMVKCGCADSGVERVKSREVLHTLSADVTGRLRVRVSIRVSIRMLLINTLIL